MRSKQKFIIAVVSFVVLSAMLLGAVVYPVFRGVAADYQKALAQKRLLLQLEEDKKSSSEFEKISMQYAQEIRQLQEVFVDSKTPIAFFRFLDETALAFGLDMEKAPGPVQHTEGDRWPSFDVRLAGKGPYPHVMAFLQKIENASYFLEVETLMMSAKKGFGDQERKGEVEFSMSLKVFTKSL